MNAPLAVAACALSCIFSAPLSAQEASSTQEPGTPEPKVQLTVIEDDSVRIEELKVRGQTQRISVQPKGIKGYEIIPADQGRDISDSAGSQRGAAGKRVWRVLTF
ncbi:hypothetical protein BURC_01191 [Burkholderiaceae bacterium]|nr:hypothetical protein BURC_01191 [Burkholderiaceae bacterium]